MQHQNQEITGALVPAPPAAPGGLPALPGPTAIRDALARGWVEAHGNSSPHTAARYRRDLSVFFEWSDRNGYDVFQMLPWHIEQYRKWLQTAEHIGRYKGQRKLSPATITGRLNAVSSYFRYCQQNITHAYVSNPAEHVKRPVVSRESKTRGLTSDELTALRKAALLRGPREYALVQLLAGTGLRISEVVAADTADLQRDGAEWYLYVVRKGSADRAPVQVPDPAARALRRYMRGRRGPLFLDDKGDRLSRQAAGNRIASLAKHAGITKAITPHSLRHTATTLALAAGVHMRDVAALMGHRSMETTARYDRANRLRDNPAARALAEVIADDLPDE